MTKPDYNNPKIDIGYYLMSRYDNDGYVKMYFYYNGELILTPWQTNFGEDGGYYFDGLQYFEFDETGIPIYE
jgi:hypothetical protein